MVHQERHNGIFVVLLPKTYKLIQSFEIIRQTQNKQYLTKKLISTLQMCQGHERQRKTEELLQARRD